MSSYESKKNLRKESGKSTLSTRASSANSKIGRLFLNSKNSEVTKEEVRRSAHIHGAHVGVDNMMLKNAD
jgi:hypothetical protein